MAAPTPPPAPTLPDQPRPPEVRLGDDTARADVLALPVTPGPDGGVPLLGTEDTTALAALAGIDIDPLSLLERHGATGAAGEVVTHALPGEEPDWLVLLGVGDQTPADLRRAGAALARATTGRGTVRTHAAASGPAGSVEAFVVGLVLGSFGFHWRSTPPEHPPVREVVLTGVDHAADELRTGLAKGGAGWRSRHLATVPANLKNPGWLADRAGEIAQRHDLDLTVWDSEALAADGFGGILAVGRASATPPRLIRLDYTPPRAGRRTPRVVLVGKGITFDSGGLSIKPGESMATMKRDMTGGGVVLATMAALADVGCPVRVTGLVPAAENAVGGEALRPGDVVRHYGGRTSEITNTDAEGRLVLGDALAYAVGLEPAVVVDVATLTGAMKVALGQRIGGYFANHEGLASVFAEAGRTSGEELWRMPLEAAYEELLSSPVADADNAAGGPGAITAALFLQHFVAGLPWVHLDVASAGDSPDERHEWSKGPTGFGTRVLLEWLGGAAPLAALEVPRTGD